MEKQLNYERTNYQINCIWRATHITVTRTLDLKVTSFNFGTLYECMKDPVYEDQSESGI